MKNEKGVEESRSVQSRERLEETAPVKPCAHFAYAFDGQRSKSLARKANKEKKNRIALRNSSVLSRKRK